MAGRRFLCLALLCLGGRCGAQTILLDPFDAGAAKGAVRSGTTWAGNVTQNPGTISIGGTARDDNGWGATGQAINATNMTFIAITGQRDPGNVATSFSIQFEDRNLNTQVFSVSSSAFAAGALTLVQISLGRWNSGFDAAQITGWSIGGGGLGLAAFRMTLDQLALTAAASPGVPVAPAIAGSFGASTRATGETVTFTVSATGTTPLTYQWFKDGTAAIANNSSATTATLTLASLTALDAGTYTCTVTNAAGSVGSGAFTLTVTGTPATVVLSNLATTYTGTARNVTATTTPAGLPVALAYNGSATPPVNAGSYGVVATVSHPEYTGRAEGTLVVAKAAQSIAFAPLPPTTRVGVPFAVGVTATSGGSVVLAVLRGNAAINGTSVTANDSATVTLRATQAGDGNYLAVTTDLAFTTTKQNQSIDFPTPPSPVISTTPVTLSATASSGLPVLLEVVSGPARVAGVALTATGSGAVLVRASQPGNDTYNSAPNVDRSLLVTLPAPPAPPAILAAPASRSVVADTALTLSVTATGDAPLSYQWSKDGVAMVGATTATLSIARATATDSGSYRVDVTSPFGTARSATAVVTVTAQSDVPAPRLVNFSTRATAGVADQVAIAGFVIAPGQPKPVLIRAVGPTLGTFGVSGVVRAPKLELFRGSTVIAANSGWTTGGAANELAAAASRVSAFALGANTADSALLATLAPGDYTAVISAADDRPGVGLVEVYDLSDAATGRGVSNLSVRALSGAAAETLIVGVVVQGTAPKRMLLRAVGPGLTQFGVSGALAQPQLAIFSGATELFRNAGWSQSPEAAVITQSSALAGAFPLVAGSQDSALIVSLPPGPYTAQVSGVGGTSGVALVEVYELP